MLKKRKDTTLDLIDRLPQVRGKYRADADLSKINWFQVGGTAEIVFKPEDTADLAHFIAHKPEGVPIITLGVGSNLLVRDGGIEGVVIRLGRGFTDCHGEGGRLTVGAGCLNSNAVMVARDHGIGGLEFLSGVPGSIGGALAMNAGAYGVETKDILVKAEAVDPEGTIHVLPADKMNYSYRQCGLPQGWIFTRATLQGTQENPDTIATRIEAISRERSLTQPIRSRTGGSTFKNPEGHKAWQLIDAAGCRGLKNGGAEISQLHCNFMINTGGATAHDLETLGETVRMRVLEQCGIMLEWEIKRVGRPLMAEAEMAVA